MSFDPYIHFQGNARAALEAYRDLFGGTLEMMTYAQMPEAPAEMQGSDLILHATLRVGGRSLMASDFPPGMAGDPQKAVSISHEAASEAEARRIFAALSEGGAVIMEFQPTFWSDGFGMVKDRFGTHWMISSPWRQPG
ncbi:VOC family protein [Tabrizicola soli]|uniref:VOC family protein n=1 Tax=Tabrizicola soli TaxID=2185115 RepID=A0ABV7E1A1_9RHOB|nr:VOC family protein [Tabrizicola soli]